MGFWGTFRTKIITHSMTSHVCSRLRPLYPYPPASRGQSPVLLWLQILSDNFMIL
jgi:hypothetical protein